MVSANFPLIDTQAAVVLCVCTRCRHHKTRDPSTHQVVEGRYVGRNERKHHIQADRGSAMAALHIVPKVDDRSQVIIRAAPPSQGTGDSHTALLSEPKGFQSLVLPGSVIERLRAIEKKVESGTFTSIDTAQFLVFRDPPSRYSQPMKTPDNDALVLHEGIPSNSEALERERWLDSAKSFIQDLRLIVSHHPEHLDDLHNLGQRIEGQIAALARLKMSFWEVQRSEACRISKKVQISNTSRYMSNSLIPSHPVTIACYVLIAFMNLICGTSLRTCKILITALKVVVTSIAGPGVRLKPLKIPDDPRRIISSLDLEPSAKAFVCCPKCFEIYPFNPATPKASPSICTFKLTPSSDACNESLRKLKKIKDSRLLVEVPVRLYHYHELQEWVANLYSRPEIESQLDDSLLERNVDGEVVWDILDAPELRKFEGPENEPKLPFLRKQGKEGRLVFSLNMDGFNPFSNKESGKKVTICAIYLICLNLPPAIRYDLENMFLVGIIPGPQEPSKEQINSLLRPLVDDLLVMWNDGFFLTSTHRHPTGRLIRGAVVPLVCDLPAARQMAGFADHSSRNFCSVCGLKAENITNFDTATWPAKDDMEYRRYAKSWKNAKSERRQAELYDLYGVRWSELLRLPYWKAIRYTVIDSMHAFLLRILQRHVRQIMGMSVDSEDGDGPCVELLEKDKPSYSAMVEARRILRIESKKRLESLKLDALRELCHAAGLRYSGIKQQLVEQLLDYRVEKGWFDEDGNVIGDQFDCLPDPKKPTVALPKRAPPTSSGTTEKRTVNDPPTQEEEQWGLDLLEYGSQGKFATVRKALLKRLCDLKGINYPVDCKGPEFVERIRKWRISSGIVDPEGFPVKAKSSESNLSRKGTKVLGRNTLKEVRIDMERLRLPSWVARAPSQPGTKKQGKLTADQWRSFCLINLTFTLTRLWGPEPEGSRKRRMLNNFLHLVTAVKIAYMRTMTPKRIADYTFHMHNYLTTLLDLYPGATVAPYQHMALHFSSFLERFGPTHAWRCFPFERYNYILQKIPTNNKFGDLETTTFKKFCMGQTLRRLFKSSKLPPELDGLVLSWEKEFKADIRGTLRGDTFSFNESFQENEESETWEPHQLKELPEIWYSYMQNWLCINEPDCNLDQLSRYGLIRDKFSRLGETYRTQATSINESNIYYRESDGSWSAGGIQGIFSHTRGHGTKKPRTQTFLIVDQYRPLPDEKASLDHFQEYSFVGGRIYQDVVFEESAIISASDLVCHFGRGDVELLEGELTYFVALPLDRT